MTAPGILRALVRALGRSEVEITVTARIRPRSSPAPVSGLGPTISAPLAGEWIPAAGVHAGTRLDVGALVGAIAGEPIESLVVGVVEALLVAPGTTVELGQPLLRVVAPP